MSLARRVGAGLVVVPLALLLGACTGQDVTAPASPQASAVSRQAEAATGDWGRALTMADYPTVVEKSSGLYVVLVGAPWCGPCRGMRAQVPYVLDSWRSPVHNYGTVDVDAEPALAAYLTIRGLPTTLLYRDGVLVAQTVGALGSVDEWMKRNGGYE
jgi:thioredoxin 1